MPEDAQQNIYDLYGDTQEFLDGVSVKYLDGAEWTLEPMTDRYGNVVPEHESRHDPFNQTNLYQK